MVITSTSPLLERAAGQVEHPGQFWIAYPLWVGPFSAGGNKQAFRFSESVQKMPHDLTVKLTVKSRSADEGSRRDIGLAAPLMIEWE